NPLPPATVGRDRPRDVVLSATGTPDVWQLRVDPTHPVLFDHAVDHVPGMLIVEAIRQAAQYHDQPLPCQLLSLQADFHHYAELDRPCTVALTRDGTGVTVTVTQDGGTVATGRATTRS
ncbi:MAG: 2-oxo-3-(phosphooxy)propyl 3-oxoalkanoate synthase, partial [Streptomycetaceae bacterium]|nr:2-oxo-3-(phosphooxy)propyl 3-oxoalkanoate synthase [Streptomycetaceae bacterium]